MKVFVLTSQKRVEAFSDLKALPQDWELKFLERGTDEEILALGTDADFIFADAVQTVSRRVIEAMPKLKLIHSEGVGYHCIDCEAARERGIYVCNSAAVNSKAVAEHTILLMLALLRRVQEGDAMVRAGRQAEAKGRFILEGLRELGGCRVGLLGFGAIGQATAKLLNAFGSETLYWAPHRRTEEEEKQCGASYLPRREVIASCDILSLHMPVTPQSMDSIDASTFETVKPGTLLINTARGELVNQADLCRALETGAIGGAGLDTLYPEPVTPENPLLHLPEAYRYKVVFTPHIAGTTADAMRTMHASAWRNMRAVAQGDPPDHIVNGVGCP